MIKLTKAFWISLIIATILSFVPYLLTYLQPAMDGMRVIGLPFPFYGKGGLCPGSDGWGQVCSFFSWAKFGIDLIFVIGIPLLINIFSLRVGKRNKV